MYVIYHSHENHNSIKHPPLLTSNKIIWSSSYGLQVGNKSTHLIRKNPGCRAEKELEEVQNQGKEDVELQDLNPKREGSQEPLDVGARVFK